MLKISAGLLMYRLKNSQLQVFLVHPGGLFWKNKDKGAWSIPKGEVDDNNFSEENLLKTAIREMKEETGITPKPPFISLRKIKQKAGKIVHCWAFQGDWSGLLMTSSYLTIEHPYKSGKKIKIPEIDKAQFFSMEESKKKINPAQVEFIDRLKEHLKEE